MDANRHKIIKETEGGETLITTYPKVKTNEDPKTGLAAARKTKETKRKAN